MKKLLCVTICFFSAVLVFSQNRADTTIFVEPVTGGSRADQSFFEENVKMEVSAAGYTIIDDLLDAIYSVSSSLAPEDDGNVLSITLSSVREGRELVAQELFYTRVEESYEQLPFLVWQMMANAPFLVSEAPPPVVIAPPSDTSENNSGRIANIVNLVNAVPDDDSWKHKWIYLGGKIGLSPRLYSPSGDDFDVWTFTGEAGVDAGIHVVNFLTIQTEAIFSLDNAEFSSLKAASADGTVAAGAKGKYTTPLFTIPFLVKGVIKPGTSYLVEPYGGIYTTIALTEDSKPSPLGWCAGLDFGIKSGAGILVFDMRFNMDLLNNTTVKDKRVEYQRYVISVTAGFRTGFMNRRQGVNRLRGARFN
ncbi:hypothetical protein TREPR_0177 [Treponema primitia ZAS-2]|uniref:Outer membrane protein beta-barrel domain-containing protein n=1 Tax=Treponema primitia (strain ATCC BAA-887 / DSM 12427 / ZAS-2) TaxID=545694 RepID=F5YME6_TREPZ|nr:hypothetical protein [Treponema primitia]AEF84584.1 hypothetical protein TREPR_0177 [Treponema primitia ZAS-2]